MKETIRLHDNNNKGYEYVIDQVIYKDDNIGMSKQTIFRHEKHNHVIY